MTDEFVKLLDQGCADLGIELSDQQKEQFFKYYEMLIEKNKVMNLTAITELSDGLILLFIVVWAAMFPSSSRITHLV